MGPGAHSRGGTYRRGSTQGSKRFKKKPKFTGRRTPAKTTRGSSTRKYTPRRR